MSWENPFKTTNIKPSGIHYLLGSWACDVPLESHAPQLGSRCHTGHPLLARHHAVDLLARVHEGGGVVRPARQDVNGIAHPLRC